MATAEPQIATPSSPSGRRGPGRLGRWLLVAVAAWVALCLLAWLLLPWVARQQIEKRGSEALGRSVKVSAVQVQPWALAVALEGLEIGGATPEAAPLLRLDRVAVNLHSLSLWHRVPVVESLRLERPRLQLARLSDGHYDVDDLLARFAGPADEPASEPARFALYNLEVVDGGLVLDDRPVGQAHRLDALQISLPFLSNLPQHLAVEVQPRLAFVLDGAHFDSGAQATPFSQSRRAQLKLQVPRLDLAPWLPYWPKGLPVRPAAGHLQADLAVVFEQAAADRPQLQLSGQVEANAFEWQDAQGTEVARWQGLHLGLKDVQPLRQRWHFDRVSWQAPDFKLRRDVRGQWNVWPAVPAAGRQASAPRSSDAASASARTAAAASAGASAVDSAAKSAPGPDVAVDRVEIQGAQAVWADQLPRTPVEWRVQGLALQVDALRWPLPPEAQSLRWQWQFELSAQLGSSRAPLAPAHLQGDGEAHAAGGRARADVAGLGLSWAVPYLQPMLVPQLGGLASGRGEWRWTGLPQAAQGQLNVDELALADLTVAAAPAGGARAASPSGSRLAWKRLQLEQLSLNPEDRQLRVGRVSLQQPDIRLQRGSDGALDVLGWWRPAEQTPAPAAEPAGSPWQLTLAETQLADGRVRWRDEGAGPEPVDLVARALQIKAGPIRWPSSRTATATPIQGSLVLQDLSRSGAAATVPAGPTASRRPPGALQWAGRLALAPLAWQGQVQAERVPVQALAGYALPDAKVAVLRAEAGWRGRVSVAQQPAGWQAQLDGDALLGDLRVHARQSDTVADDELLSWQALALDGLKLQVQPGRPPEVVVREARLNDAFARLVVTEAGHLNLTDLAAAPPAAAASAPHGGNASGVVAAVASSPAPSPASVPAVSPAVSGTATAPPVLVDVGAVLIRNARVDFSDRFIRPNYRADLTELNGRVGAFATGRTEPTPLELKGRAAGTALLDIRGTVNPTARPLSLDIQARATDLELAPLTPYAGKYAGYAIERGKLSMDVSYRIQPDGRLDAKNQIILNQLTFGERIDSPDATKLPVLLAVALLKDRQGVIDLDLPISGSLQDPQFSMGGLIIKVIVNVLTKAITAPFSLLAGGGGDELSHVEFLPGTARLAGSAAAVIDKVGRALQDRPALKMTVTGVSDPQSEREAIQAAQLESRVLAEQRKEWLRNGRAAQAELPPLTSAERQRLVAQVYGETRLPNKPRNLVGLAKDIPPADMEALLKAAVAVNTDTARELALQRGLVVRDALIARGLPADRLFLSAPRLRASTEDDVRWTPRVQLSLGTQ